LAGAKKICTDLSPFVVTNKDRAYREDALTTIVEGKWAEDDHVAAEDASRAALYRFLSLYLSKPPDVEAISRVATLKGDTTSSLGRALTALAFAAQSSDAHAVDRAYHDLFIGLGRGELVPYGSYYLTGFLQEKPLAKLRQDMSRLGIARNSAVSEPEDHAASELEIMAGLIDGAFGAPLSLHRQQAFFDTHLSSWLPVFFRDLEQVRTSAFYAALGRVGREFIAVETDAFAMV
jgi:TorA maturation chaperone TorD